MQKGFLKGTNYVYKNKGSQLLYFCYELKKGKKNEFFCRTENNILRFFAINCNNMNNIENLKNVQF